MRKLQDIAFRAEKRLREGPFKKNNLSLPGILKEAIIPVSDQDVVMFHAAVNYRDVTGRAISGNKIRTAGIYIGVKYSTLYVIVEYLIAKF